MASPALTPTTSPPRLRDSLVPAYGPSVASAIGAGATMPVIALTARELGASVSLSAVVVGLALMSEVVFSLPGGSLVHRLGERRAMVLAASVDAIACYAAALAPSLAVLIVAVVVSGWATAVFVVARHGFLIDLVPPERHARAMSTLGGVLRFGMFVGPLLGAPAISWMGPRGGFLVAGVALSAAAIVAFASPDITAEYDAKVASEPKVPTLTVLRRHREVYTTVGLGAAAISMLRSGRIVLLPLWAQHIGLTGAQTSVIFGLSAALELMMFYPVGSLMDRHGRVWAAVPSASLLSLALALLPATSTLTQLSAVAVVAAIGNGFGSGIVMTLGADCAPSVARAQFLGGWRLVAAAGNSSAPILIAGLSTASLAVACCAVASVGGVGAAWLARFVPRHTATRASGR